MRIAAMVTVLAPQSSLSGNLAEQGRYLSTRVVSLFDSGDTSIAWRNTLWRVALADLMERPWSGQGLGQKVFIDMGSYKEYVELRNIHNSFLAILTQLGFVGLCLLAVLVLIWLYRMWTCKATEAWRTTVRYSALGMIIFCVVTFLFQPYLEANFFSIWWWLALGWGRAYYEGSLS
jgi:O-antigen ligase